ncbi:MAG: hypothetical protein Q9226_005849, partial [Calogaya cf. arnoldii]
ADSKALADANGSVMPATLVLWHPTTQLFAPWICNLKEYDGLDCRNTVIASHGRETRAKMRLSWHPRHSAQYMWNKSSLAIALLSRFSDRTEMAQSVEARTPFLDHQLTEYVNKLPPSVKLAYSALQIEEQSEQGPLWKKAGKTPFLAPTRWPNGGPLHQLFQKVLTREAVKALGFLDYAVVEEALKKAYNVKEDKRALRTLVYIGAWVTLGERFGIKKANRENWVGGDQIQAASQSLSNGTFSSEVI